MEIISLGSLDVFLPMIGTAWVEQRKMTVLSEPKLSESIEAFLTRESEPLQKPDIHRLSPWAAAFVTPCLLIPSFLIRARFLVWSDVLNVLAILLVLFFIERRRVCRVEIDGSGMKCYGLTGRLFLEIDRKSVQDVDLDEGTGKDYHVLSAGRRYRIPAMYDGYHKVIGVLETWAAENRSRPSVPRA